MIEVNKEAGSTTFTGGESDQDAPSAIGFAVLLLRHRLLIVRLVLLALMLAVIAALLAERDYTSSSVFMPQGRSTNTSASMSGLAAQLGLSMASSDPTQNPAFYADLIKARAILEPTVVAFSPQLRAAYKISERDTAVARESLRLELAKHVTASVDARTGVVRLSVNAPEPKLAQAINRTLLDVVNEFNLRGRQSQAGAEREFVERRLSEVRAELRAAEDRLADFLRSNRNYQNSPDLLFAYNRLNRQVSDQQQLASMLEQSYERSKIDEARDTPVITLVESPNLPVRPDSRGLGKKLAIALALGLFAGIGMVYARSIFTRDQLARVNGYAELQKLASSAKWELHHPLRLLARIAGINRIARN
jgi:uncharacterized protein involved in exopolysaccharide biosynthesis